MLARAGPSHSADHRGADRKAVCGDLGWPRRLDPDQRDVSFINERIGKKRKSMSDMPLYEFSDEERDIILPHLLESNFKGKLIGRTGGQVGEIYILEREGSDVLIAVKCPRVMKFGSKEKARSGIERALHEAEKTHLMFNAPWVNKISDIKFILGWPFIQSRFRSGTLQSLILGSRAWSIQDKMCSLIQIIRALILAREAGISAHQDLKPENIFFDDKSRDFPELKGTKGLRFWMYVADFGLADAFREFGINDGERPYMAPEQFSKEPFEPSGLVRFDVFALGVIAHECLRDGQHPIGVDTSDCWPWREGMEKKWKLEDVWKKWARKTEKTLPDSRDPLPRGMDVLILAALAADPADRPSLDEFESQLWHALEHVDPETCAGLRMQIDHFESNSPSGVRWPHMDQRLMELREFYSQS
jgi:serine/threonine protein kinase